MEKLIKSITLILATSLVVFIDIEITISYFNGSRIPDGAVFVYNFLVIFIILPLVLFKILKSKT